VSAVASAEAVIPRPMSSVNDGMAEVFACSGDGGVVRRQRVKVPMRLVTSAFYADVALSVYMKVKALGARPEGCEAKAATIASYLGLSTSSVERGLRLLSREAPDGVIELRSERRTLPGGRGTSAVRRTRPLTRSEGFVWLSVAASEDLTPRQLRAYAVIVFAEQMGMPLTEGELAGFLLHHSGKQAGQPITVTAAGMVVDELEASRWLTVQRRAGRQGRHRYVPHDIAPAAALDTREPVADMVPGTAPELGEEAAGAVSAESASSQVGDGSGSQANDGSLTKREVPMTDSPDDGRAFFSPAAGEVPVVGGPGPVENQAGAKACTDAWPGLALRADENSQPVPSKPEDEKRSSSGGVVRPSYTGPQLAMDPMIYAVLEPVHWLLAQVNSPFVERQIAREVARQLEGGMGAERLRHRLTARFAGTMASDIRDPGRWLLGVALPRWGCGHLDCETGVMWSTGRRCEVCAEVVAAKAAARRRAERVVKGLCPEHGSALRSAGVCPACETEQTVGSLGAVPAARAPEGPPRGSCGECGCRIVLVGPALTDGLCKLCREEAAALAAGAVRDGAERAGPATCPGIGGVPCGRVALPTRNVCARHRVHELTLLDAEAS
jgi:hypothetical protein